MCFIFVLIFVVDGVFRTDEGTEVVKDSLTTLGIALSFFFLFLSSILEQLVYSRANYFISLFGVGVCIIGLVIRGTAIKTLGKYFSENVAIKKDHKIIKTGIYKKIRHPAYLGDVFILFGLPLIVNSYYSIVFSFLGLVVLLIRISIEEKELIKNIPEYKKYKNKTRKL